MATEKSSTVTPTVSNVAPLNKRVNPFRNETLFWKLKEMFHFADAILRLSPNEDNTEDYLLVLLHGHLEDLMMHYEALAEQDDEDLNRDVANRGLEVVMAELKQQLTGEA